MTRPAVAPAQARILVVEDDANNRLVVTKLLQAMGVPRASILETEGNAADYMREHAPGGVHLILLDLQLPGKDGFILLQELRADPAFAGIPVAAVTANVMRQHVEQTRAAGFDGFISKPIDGRRFSEWIRRLLSGEQLWTSV